MKLFKYNQFIKESIKDDLSPKLDNKYKEIKEEIIDLIEKSIKSEDTNVFNEFINSYVKNPDETEIEGLINDSDIYDFYLKYRNDIDEILNEIKYFDDIPSEENIYGIYEYTIKATKKAISEIVRLIKNEILDESEISEGKYEPYKKITNIAKIKFNGGRPVCICTKCSTIIERVKYNDSIDGYETLSGEKIPLLCVSCRHELLKESSYPTIQDVENANHEQICRWYRYLPSPGNDYLGKDNFKEIMDKEENVMNLICKKFKEGGGFNPELSKKIGFNNESLTHNYGSLIPDQLIDTFYKVIEKCIEDDKDYLHYIKSIKSLNGDVIPEKINKLLNDKSK